MIYTDGVPTFASGNATPHPAAAAVLATIPGLDVTLAEAEVLGDGSASSEAAIAAACAKARRDYDARELQARVVGARDRLADARANLERANDECVRCEHAVTSAIRATHDAARPPFRRYVSDGQGCVVRDDEYRGPEDRFPDD